MVPCVQYHMGQGLHLSDGLWVGHLCCHHALQQNGADLHCHSRLLAGYGRQSGSAFPALRRQQVAHPQPPPAPGHAHLTNHQAAGGGTLAVVHRGIGLQRGQRAHGTGQQQAGGEQEQLAGGLTAAATHFAPAAQLHKRAWGMLLNARQRVSGAYTMRCCSCTPPGSVYGVNRGAAAVLLQGEGSGGRRRRWPVSSGGRDRRAGRCIWTARRLPGGRKGKPPCVLETVRPLQGARPALGLLRPMCCIAHTEQHGLALARPATHGTAILVGAPGPLLLASWRFQRLVAAAPAQSTRATMYRLALAPAMPRPPWPARVDIIMCAPQECTHTPGRRAWCVRDAPHEFAARYLR